MPALSSGQLELLKALATAQSAVPKGGHKQFMTTSTFDGVAVILADGRTNLPLDTTDLDQLVDAGLVKITRQRGHGDMSGIVTAQGLAFLEAQEVHSVQSAAVDSGAAQTGDKRNA